MTPFITLTIPTLSRYDLLKNCLQSIAQSTRHPDSVLIIDNGGNLEPIEVEWEDEKLGKCTRRYGSIYKPPKNLGVSGSCNLGCKWAANAPCGAEGLWLWCNDDCEIGKNTIEKLEQAAIASPKMMMFIPEDGMRHAFSFFLMRAQMALSEVGEWDEKFYPAYHEDNDYIRRMNLKGYGYQVVYGTDGYIHHISSTLKSYTPEQMEQHHKDFSAGRQYYIEKWGGPPDQEKFHFPFDRPELEID